MTLYWAMPALGKRRIRALAAAWLAARRHEPNRARPAAAATLYRRKAIRRAVETPPFRFIGWNRGKTAAGGA
jgi:hypothetical protein